MTCSRRDTVLDFFNGDNYCIYAIGSSFQSVFFSRPWSLDDKLRMRKCETRLAFFRKYSLGAYQVNSSKLGSWQLLRNSRRRKENITLIDSSFPIPVKYQSFVRGLLVWTLVFHMLDYCYFYIYSIYSTYFKSSLVRAS